MRRSFGRDPIAVEAIVEDICGLIRLAPADQAAVQAALASARGMLDRLSVPSLLVLTGSGPVLTAQVGPSDGPTVIWHGYLDVVPASDPSQYEPQIRDGRLYGRGAYDMLAGCVCMVHALARAAEQNRVRVRLVLVPDEEHSVRPSIVDYAVRHGTGDFVITGEPTNLKVCIEAKGAMFWRLIVHGRSTHSSTPWLGENPIETAYPVWERIRKLPFAAETTRWYPDGPSLAPTIVSAGAAANVIPDTCLWEGTIRYLPGQDVEQIARQIRGLSGTGGLPQFEFEVLSPGRPVSVPPDDPYVLTLIKAVGDCHPDNQVLDVRHGGSDLAKIDTPGVEFGPDGAGHHSPDEYVTIASLGPYTEALLEFVPPFRHSANARKPLGLEYPGVAVLTARGWRCSPRAVFSKRSSHAWIDGCPPARWFGG